MGNSASMVSSSSSSAALLPSSLVNRFLMSAQKMANPHRTMFERIFLKGESQSVVTQSMGLTKGDYEQMLRILKDSAQ